MPIDASLAEPIQTTLELGVSLSEVTFCVVDLETTGGSPVDDAITEIGAVKYRGGERIGSFGRSWIPGGRSRTSPTSPVSTTTSSRASHDRAGAARVPRVLPWVGLRGAQRGFDFGFLNANCDVLDYPALPGPPLCTAGSRVVVWPDVPNVRLATLANYFRTRAKPTTGARRRRGMRRGAARIARSRRPPRHPDDGRPRRGRPARGRPNFGKIQLADRLPHAPGVYCSRLATGGCSTWGRPTTCARG